MGESYRVDRKGPAFQTATTSHSATMPHHARSCGRPNTCPVKWMALTADSVTRKPTASQSCPPNSGCVSPRENAA